MSTTVTGTDQPRAPGTVWAPAPPQGGPALLPGEALYVDDLAVPGAAAPERRAQPIRPRPDHRDRPVGGPGDARRRRRLHRRRPARASGPRRCPARGRSTADMKNPPHYPLATDEVALRGRRRGGRGGRDRAHRPGRGVERSRSTTSRSPPLSTSRTRRRTGYSVHAALGTNRSYIWELAPDAEAVERAFAEAPTSSSSERYVQQRLIPNAIEPRGVCVVPQPFGGEYTHLLGDADPAHPAHVLALTLGIPEAQAARGRPGRGRRLRLEARTSTPRSCSCVALARRLRRPVQVDRGATEDSQSRRSTAAAMIQQIELAADARRQADSASGSDLLRRHGRLPAARHAGHPAARRLPVRRRLRRARLRVQLHGVFTNKTPTDAYRGAGRPEATYAIERAMDALARELGMDPVGAAAPELHPHGEVPVHRDRPGLTIDSGNYARRRSTRPLELARLRRACEPSSRRAASAGDRSSSGSASRPTSRCAASRRRGSWRRSTTRRAAGRPPRSGSCPPARYRW